MANAILQPPRSFQLTVRFTFPADARTDDELIAFILTNISNTLGLGGFGAGAACARIPYVERPQQ